jgi:predicted RNA-binding protein with PUA-like domain
MAHWMMKTEPGEFSFDDLLRDGKTTWDGVRNHQAKKNLAAMAIGDHVLIYHSVSDKEVVGLAEVIKTAYPDPTDPDQKWLVVDIKPLEKLKSPISLHTVKQTPTLAEIPLVKQSRLSVMPLPAEAFNLLLEMGGIAPARK